MTRDVTGKPTWRHGSVHTPDVTARAELPVAGPEVAW